MRASLSRFYQPPQPEYLLLASSPEARAAVAVPRGGRRRRGGADVEPERQWAFEAGVEHRFGRGLRLRRRLAGSVGSTSTPIRTCSSGRRSSSRTPSPRGGPAASTRGSRCAPGGAWSGYGNVSVGKVTQTGPITGGLFLEDDVADIGPGVEFVPDHDQRVVASGGLTWTGRRGVTLSATARYESGTPIELDDDEEADELAERPGADRVDFDEGRVKPRTIVSLIRPACRCGGAARVELSLRGAVLNLFDASYAYNFGNPFSGTHFGAPRTFALSVRIEAR